MLDVVEGIEKVHLERLHRHTEQLISIVLLMVTDKSAEYYESARLDARGLPRHPYFGFKKATVVPDKVVEIDSDEILAVEFFADDFVAGFLGQRFAKGANGINGFSTFNHGSHSKAIVVFWYTAAFDAILEIHAAVHFVRLDFGKLEMFCSCRG